jgi:hypothetical protein
LRPIVVETIELEDVNALRPGRATVGAAGFEYEALAEIAMTPPQREQLGDLLTAWRRNWNS